jgi:hypothetical protein
MMGTSGSHKGEQHYIPIVVRRLWCLDCKAWQLYEDVTFSELSCQTCGSILVCDDCGAELRQDRRLRRGTSNKDRRHLSTLGTTRASD